MNRGGAPNVPYMAALQVAGRRCVVIGGGEAAAVKVRLLLASDAEITLFAPRAVPELRGLARDGAINWIAREFRSGDLDGAFIAIDTVQHDAVQRAVSAEARTAGALLNTMDRAELCDFIAPAVVQRGPLQIAVSTSGESPYLAAHLRRVLERLIEPEWGQLTALIGTVRRRLRRRGVAVEAQTHAYRRLARPDVRKSLREGDYAAAAALAAALADDPAANAGHVTLVGAGPGDPRLLTLAAVDAIAGADVVLHDALVDAAVLRLCAPHAQVIDVGKRGGAGGARQQDIITAMRDAAHAGFDVVRLKGGDPFLFARGGEELQSLVDEGIDVTVIPGITAAMAAPAAAGIPLTQRGVASSVAFVTGHDRNGRVNPELDRIAKAVDTLVVLMPLGTLPGIVDVVIRAVGPTRPAAIISSATQAQQQVVRAPLEDLVAAARRAEVAGPATLVIGDVARPRQAPEVRPADPAVILASA